MGRSKLALPVGSSTVLEQLVGTLRECGVLSILVVLAPGEERLPALAVRAGARAVHLPEVTADMRATVAFGLRSLREHDQAKDGDSWLLIPADHPALDANSLRQLLAARNGQPADMVYIPTFEGQRGHPAILPFSLSHEITNLPEGEGINQLLRRHTNRTLLVPVDSPAVLWDLDTEEDYAKLLAHFASSKGGDQTSVDDDKASVEA